MNDAFDNEDELLMRGVLPDNMFWHEDGTLSSAVFKDKEGLSVDRDGGRPFEAALAFAKQHLQGKIAVVTVGACHAAEAVVLYLPEPENDFHSEIHQSLEKPKLSNSQIRQLLETVKIF